MDTNKILSADFLDILFDDRNKDYGAYELRKTYQRRVTKSLLATGLFVLLAFSGVVLANKLSPKEKSELFIRAITLVDIPDEIEPPPKPEPPRIIEPPQVQTEEFAQIVVVDDNEVETPLPTQEDLINAQIDFSKNEGVIYEGIIALQNLDDGKDLIEVKNTRDPDEPFTKVEIPGSKAGLQDAVCVVA